MKISVIIPLYNVEQYVSRCLETVINQTYNNLEILVIDDGSTDNSLQIAKSFELKDDRVKVISQLNGGVSSARNLGLDNATGQLIGFVDPDDWIDLKMYEILVDLMSKHEADVSTCHLRGCFLRDYIEPNRNDIKIEVFDHIETLEKFLDSGYSFNGLNAVVVNRIYKKEIFRNLRFNQNLIKGEDTEITHKIFFKSKKLVYTDERLYFYFRRNDGLTHSEISTEDKLKVDINLLDMFNDKIRKTKGKVIYQNVYKKSINDLLSYNIELYFSYSNQKAKEKMKKKFNENYFHSFWFGLKQLTVLRNLRFLLFRFSPIIYKKMLLN